MDFSEWIVSELEKRGWSRSEAARRGEISPSMFDKVINGHAKPGMRFVEGIARAFKMTSAEVIMRIDEKQTDDLWAEQMSQKIKLVPPSLRNLVNNVIDSAIRGEEVDQQKRKTPAKKSL